MEPAISKETLAAFVDGELPPKQMERIAALLSERADLDAYVRRHEHLRTDLRGAFAEILDAPVPERLLQVARTAPASKRWRLRQMARAMSWRALMPVAAALSVGLVIGLVLQPSADLSSSASGQLVAQGALRRALDRQLASAGYSGSGPRIGISFRNKAGEDCRTFVDSGASGLACHNHDSWVIGTLVNQNPDTSSYAYRMAGAEMPAAVRSAVAASIVGTPFDAPAERAARQSGWR